MSDAPTGSSWGQTPFAAELGDLEPCQQAIIQCRVVVGGDSWCLGEELMISIRLFSYHSSTVRAASDVLLYKGFR